MGTRVYLGGIPPRTREKDVERFLRKYGRIRDILIKSKYAFIEFEDYRDADDAVYDLHGTDFLGERVTCELAKGTPHGRDKDRWGSGGRSGRRSRSRSGDRKDGRRPVWLDKYGPPTRTDYRVIVENLSSRVSWQDLKDFMRSAGEVTYADAHKSRKNEGVVEFSRYDDVQNAIDKLDDTELNGRRIKIIDDSRKKKRSRSRSRSRSRTRSRSRRGRSGSRQSRSRSKSPARSKSGRSASRSRSRSGSGKRNKADNTRSEDRERSKGSDREGSKGDREMKSRSVSRSRSRSQ